MTDIKRALEAERTNRDAKQLEDRIRDQNSPGRLRDRSNAEKAKHLNSFAWAVLQRFANETEKIVTYLGTNCDMYRDCIAVYQFHRRVKSFLSVKLYPMFDVAIGTR